jgi:hypothetical protein
VDTDTEDSLFNIGADSIWDQINKGVRGYMKRPGHIFYKTNKPCSGNGRTLSTDTWIRARRKKRSRRVGWQVVSDLDSVEAQLYHHTSLEISAGAYEVFHAA